MANELFAGSQVIVYASREATYGTARRLNGGDAMLTISESFTPAEERDVRPDRSRFADYLDRYVGQKNAIFEITRLLLPSAARPSDDLLWQNAFGRSSLNATSLEYILATAHDWSLTLRRAIRTGGGQGVADFQEHVRGAIVNQVEISEGNQGQNGLATVTFRGVAKDWGWTGNTSVGSGYLNISSAASTFRVSSPRQLTVNSLFKVKTSTGGGSGILVDTVNYTTSVISFSESLGTTLSSGRAITPYNPTATTAGQPLHARIGMLSLDGSATKIDHLGGRVTLEDNRGLLNEEVGYDSASRVIRENRRNVIGTFGFILKKDEVGELLGRRERNDSRNVQVNIGDEANKTIKIHMRDFEWDMSALDMPDQGMTRITMAGRALGTNGNDSLKVRFMFALSIGHWTSDIAPAWNTASQAERNSQGFWCDSNGYASVSDSSSLAISKWE